MQGITILVAAADAERLHAALTFAAAGAATGAAVRLHLHEGAVAILGGADGAPGDAGRRAAGLPTLAEILEEALGLDVAITVCQSGLAMAGLSLDQFDSRIEAQGPVAMLAALGDDRLITF